MKISTKGRYGTRFMVDLALHDGQGPVALRDVAARQEISDKYLEQIVQPLSKAGLIRSVRGPQGGYLLAMTPADITVGMVLRVLEGSLAPVECVTGDLPCERRDNCLTIGVWTRMHQAVQEIADSTTLASLIAEAQVSQRE